MARSILVTGASGLLGANVCRIAAEQGRQVRALLRNQADLAPLAPFGVEPVFADIGDSEKLRSIVDGVDGVIHTAALLGGSWSKATPADFDAINYRAVGRLLDAAAEAGGIRTILVSSVIVFDSAVSITEASPVHPITQGDSPYTNSKRSSYYDGMHRACRGQNLAFVVPGAIYGPSPNVDRALADTSYTGALRKGIQGELDEFAAFPMNFVFAEDVARVCLAALDESRIGVRYVAAGPTGDECSLALFCNEGAEIAGSRHRVKDLPLAEIKANLGPMAALASRHYAKPYLDGSVTQARFGLAPTGLREGLARTIDWMRAAGRL